MTKKIISQLATDPDEATQIGIYLDRHSMITVLDWKVKYITIGSCFSVLHRIMVHAESLDSMKGA